MWDNRCALYYAVHDYGEAPRVMHRITVAGDIPRLGNYPLNEAREKILPRRTKRAERISRSASMLPIFWS